VRHSTTVVLILFLVFLFEDGAPAWSGLVGCRVMQDIPREGNRYEVKERRGRRRIEGAHRYLLEESLLASGRSIQVLGRSEKETGGERHTSQEHLPEDRQHGS
jgi:hypothetical protein